MEQPRIFISHSNSDPDSPAYVEAANHALTAAGFEVLVDRIRLQPGEEWRDEIYLWMGLCHGAVVLVSPAAIKIESIWVPRETSILLWRRTLDPRFIVIPVFLGGVTAADLQRGAFADMQLTEIQAVPATTPTELANLLVARFSGLIREKSPLETLASRMAELLRSLNADHLLEIAEQLNVNLGPWSGINDSHYKLALALLQVPLGEPKLVNALTVLAEYLDSAKADQILSIVAPTWVDPRAARWLADCGRRGDNKPAVMLNGSTHFCAAMYIHRASCRPPKTRWRIVQVTGVHGEHTAEEIAAEMEQNLISELRLVADSFAENARESLRERLMVLLRDLQNGGHPVFVVLQFSAVIATVLTELQQLLPAVTFVLLSGIDFPPSDLLHDQRVKLVEPKLEPGLEERAQSDFDYARSIVRPGQAGAY